MRIKLLGGRITLGKDLSPNIGTADNLFAIMQQKYGVDYVTKNRLKAYRNIVYGCVSLIGSALGDYQPYVEQKRGDKWVRIDHEFISLLRQPSGRSDPQNPKANSFSAFDLWEATGSFQELQGDAFWYMALGKSTGRPREIIMMRADKVGTDIDPKTGDINGYFIRREGADPIPLEVNEVLRFPLFNPESPYKGRGPVEAGSDYIETDEATATYTKNFFYNSAGLSGVLNIKGEVTKGAFRKFVRAWREKYEGVNNAGKVAILRDSDADFTKVGLGLDELNMAELRQMTLEDVFMMFKVPPALLGKVSDGTGLGRGNIETLEYIFAKWNIDKKMTRFDNIIQFALQRYYQLDPAVYRVCHENIIPVDKDYELQELEAGVDKWITRDEARADAENAPTIPGGDQLFVPINMVPLDEAANAAAPSAASASGLTVKVTRTVKKKAEKRLVTPAQAERFRLTLMRNQLKYERAYKKALRPVFLDQRKEALNNLEAHGSGLKKQHEAKLFDDAAADNKMTAALTPVLGDLSKTQGQLAMTFAGDGENEFYLTAEVLSRIARSTRKMATGFNDETITKLNNTLAEGVQNGEPLSDLKARVNSVYNDIDGYRSERIARTETLKASNGATADAYRQTGYVTQKIWVVNPDACPECEVFDGKVVGLDDSFLPVGASYTVGEGDDAQTITNDYDDVDEPPLHPNCRCTIIPGNG